MRITLTPLGAIGILCIVGGPIYIIVGGKTVATAKPVSTARSVVKLDTTPTPKLAYTWKNVKVVGGGFVTGIITHPTEKGLMYARTDVGGAYRWEEKDKQWIPLTDHFGQDDWNFTGIESIAVDPTNPNRVYIAVGTYTNDWAGNGAIIRSNDRGNTWKLTSLPFKNGGNMDGRSAGERLTVDPNQPSHLLYGSRDTGMWESRDSGTTWSQHKSFPVKGKTNGTGIVFVLFDAKSGGKNKPSKTIYAGVSDKTNGLYRSNDNGATWKAIPNPKPFLPNHGVLDGRGNLYVSSGDAPGPNGMSDGAIWKLNTVTDAWSDITPEKPDDGNKFGYGGVTVDTKNPQTVMVSTMDRWAKHDTIFRTTDGGKAWRDIGPQSERDSSLSPYLNWGKPSADLGHWLGDIEIDPHNPDRVLYVTGATIWTSRDATAADKNQPTHWIVGANGLEETVPTNIISPGTGASLLSSMGDIDGFRHVNFDESPRSGFYQPSHGTSTDIDFAEKQPNIVARVHSSGGYSEDNGVTWKDFATKPGQSKQGKIAVSADGSSFVWTPEGNTGSFVSRDKGASWNPVSGLPAGVERVASDREDPKRFYAVSGGMVYVSENGGESFAAKGTGLPNGSGYVHAVPGISGDVWYCAEQGGLHHSLDAGTTWAKNDGIIEAKCIGFGKPAPGRDYPTIFIAGKSNGQSGFFQSDDAGNTWVRINDDRSGFHSINAITGDPRVYGRVYLATGGRGIIIGESQRK